jgi:hypothetical protein
MGERKQVTVLFGDVKRSMDLAATLFPTEIRETSRMGTQSLQVLAGRTVFERSLDLWS